MNLFELRNVLQSYNLIFYDNPILVHNSLNLDKNET